jgi:ubiquinone biosynthesis protein COQ9
MLTDNEKKIFQEKIKGVTSTNKKITILLNAKLQHDLKNKNQIKKLMKDNVKKCNKDFFYIYNVSSDIWHLAGDQSTDYNFYTKRLILSGILFKLYFKILTLKEYKEEELSKDIDSEILKVGKFNKIKAEFLSLFENSSIFNKKKGTKTRGF